MSPSWNDYRLETDVSGPSNAWGVLAGRLIYANEDTGKTDLTGLMWDQSDYAAPRSVWLRPDDAF